MSPEAVLSTYASLGYSQKDINGRPFRWPSEIAKDLFETFTKGALLQPVPDEKIPEVVDYINDSHVSAKRLREAFTRMRFVRLHRLEGARKAQATKKKNKEARATAAAALVPARTAAAAPAAALAPASASPQPQAGEPAVAPAAAPAPTAARKRKHTDSSEEEGSEQDEEEKGEEEETGEDEGETGAAHPCRLSSRHQAFAPTSSFQSLFPRPCAQVRLNTR